MHALVGVAGVSACISRLGDAGGFFETGVNFLEVDLDGGFSDCGVHGDFSLPFAGTTHAPFRREVERKLSNLVAQLPPYRQCHDRWPDKGPSKREATINLSS
jgi:hypothetical protein